MDSRLEALDDALFQPLNEQESLSVYGGETAVDSGCEATAEVTYNGGWDGKADIKCKLF